MKKCLIVGGGIEGLFTAFMIKNNKLDIDITLKTINSDPRKIIMDNDYGATWSGLSSRHITYFEGYNRNILKLNELIFNNTVNNGGWLGKEKQDFSKEEKAWLKRRIAAQYFTSFNEELYKYYQEYNTKAIHIWHSLIETNSSLFDNTHITYGVKKLYNKVYLEKQPYQEFTLSIHNLAINILNYLELSGVHLEFNTHVKSIQHFQDVIISVGAYDHKLLNNTSATNRICAVAGAWLTGTSYTNEQNNFQLCTSDVWQQNFTHIQSNQYIIGAGYAFVGFDLNTLCNKQKAALVDRSIKLAQRFCYNVKPINKICFRAFTDNDVPLLNVEKNKMGGSTIIIGGMNTGTTTAAPHTGQIVANILDNRHDPWLERLSDFNKEWTNFITHKAKIF